MSFAHLHVHTEYTVLRALCRIPELFSRAEEIGLQGLAITDTNTLAGVPAFLWEARKHPDVKPILGCELSVLDDLKGEDSARVFPVVLLAKNASGYRNLVKLVSFAGTSKPRAVPHRLLEEYRDGLICLSGNHHGEVASAILEGKPERAKEAALWYLEVFRDDYYFEVIRHTAMEGMEIAMNENLAAFSKSQFEIFHNQVTVSDALFALSRETDIPLVLTNDVYYVRLDDAMAHDTLLCISEDKKIEDKERTRASRVAYLKSEKEMNAFYPEKPELIKNTFSILQKISPVDIYSDPVLPRMKTEDAEKELRDAVIAGAVKRYGVVDNALRERIDGEIDSFRKAGFVTYPFILKEVVDWARGKGFPVGPGRGSAAGSIVAYCLGITEVDPLRYGLLSERFLDPDRLQLPDIDLDLGAEALFAVQEHLGEIYGAESIARVSVYKKINTVRALRMAARAHSYPVVKIEGLLRLIPKEDIYVDDIPFSPTIANALEYVPKLKARLEDSDIATEEVLRCAARIEGTICEQGVHASAVVIAPGPVSDFAPVQTCESPDGEKTIVTQYGIWDVENAGLLKQDFLGLVPLDIIAKTLRAIGEDIDLEKVALEDPIALELFYLGETAGVFQFESELAKEGFKITPNLHFNDIVALSALLRSPANALMTDFVYHRAGLLKSAGSHFKAVRETLEDTCGLLLFQEQLMTIVQSVGGLTPGQSNLLRKALGRGDRQNESMLHQHFIEGGKKKGYKESSLEEVWATISHFGPTASLKAHCVCYAIITMETAYLKVHYPIEFFQAAYDCYKWIGLDTEALEEEAKEKWIPLRTE